MLSFLRSNHFGVALFSLLTLGVLWGLAWAFPPLPASCFDWYKMPLYQMFETMVPPHSAGSMGLAVALTLAQALLLVWWNERFDFIPRVYFMPGFFYVLITGSFPVAQQLNPALVFGILLSVALIQMMDSLRQEATSFHAMGAALLITVGGFLYLWGMVYLVLIWIILFNLRSWSWREMSGSILGIILPLFLTFSVLYLWGSNVGALFQNLHKVQLSPRYDLPQWPLPVWVLLGYMAVLFLITFPTVVSGLFTEKVMSRKGFSIMAWMSVITWATFLLIPSYHPELYWIMAIPLAFLYSYCLSRLRSKKWANSLIFVWIALIIWVRVHYLFFL